MSSPVSTVGDGVDDEGAASLGFGLFGFFGFFLSGFAGAAGCDGVADSLGDSDNDGDNDGDGDGDGGGGLADGAFVGWVDGDGGCSWGVAEVRGGAVAEPCFHVNAT